MRNLARFLIVIDRIIELCIFIFHRPVYHFGKIHGINASSTDFLLRHIQSVFLTLPPSQRGLFMHHFNRVIKVIKFFDLSVPFSAITTAQFKTFTRYALKARRATRTTLQHAKLTHQSAFRSTHLLAHRFAAFFAVRFPILLAVHYSAYDLFSDCYCIEILGEGIARAAGQVIFGSYCNTGGILKRF